MHVTTPLDGLMAAGRQEGQITLNMRREKSDSEEKSGRAILRSG